MNLKELLFGVEVEKIYNEANPEITGVCYNSSKVSEGCVFVAIAGFKTDGHSYISDAVAKGASVIVCQRYISGIDAVQVIVKDSRIAEAQISANFFGRPSERFKIIGVTGTNGKTTVTYLVKQILDYCGFKTGLIGTNQNMIADKVIETGRTTPDSFELQKLFFEMAEDSVDYVVMEVSSHALELNRVYGLHFAVAAFTNLTRDHLDFHKTMDNYACAKSKLFAMCDTAIINTDDIYGKQMANNAPCKVTTYSQNNASDLVAQNVVLGKGGVSFTIDDVNYTLSIPGEFSVYNAMCAIGICRTLGIDSQSIKKALSDAVGVKGRAELVDIGQRDYSIIIDYAHTPDGLENILNAVRQFAKGRVIIVFGCGGDRDSGKRPEMGRIAGELADFSIITSDNPRTEDPMSIIKMVEDGIKKTNGKYTVVENRREAIRYAIECAAHDDVIILAGKGHETYQIIGNETIHFDEREIVREILKKE